MDLIANLINKVDWKGRAEEKAITVMLTETIDPKATVI